MVLVLLTAGGVVWGVHLLRGDGSGDGSGASGALSAGTRTVKAVEGTVTATVEADGSVEAVTTATADFATDGTVTGIRVKVGDKVTQGVLLATVDTAAPSRALKLAQADLAAANDALERAEDAGSDTSSAESQVTQAQLSVEEAQADVDGTRLVAPMTGTITAINGSVGANSAINGENSDKGGFVELANLDTLQVAAQFAEEDATQLVIGQEATITWQALTDASATGKVTAIDPTATSSNDVVSYGATITINELPTGAKPGQSVTVAVTTGTAENVVSVNSAAVTLSGNSYSVTVRNTDGSTTVKTVTVGVKGATSYEIKNGLAAGETVIVPESSTTSGDSGQQQQQQGPGGNLPGGGGPP